MVKNFCAVKLMHLEFSTEKRGSDQQHCIRRDPKNAEEHVSPCYPVKKKLVFSWYESFRKKNNRLFLVHFWKKYARQDAYLLVLDTFSLRIATNKEGLQ